MINNFTHLKKSVHLLRNLCHRWLSYVVAKYNKGNTNLKGKKFNIKSVKRVE